MPGALKEYEAILIADPQLNEEALNQLKNQMAELVSRHGGRVQEHLFLGRRKMSYRIGRHSEGNYVQVKIEMPPAGLEGFKRMANLIEPVLRMMVVASAGVATNNNPPGAAAEGRAGTAEEGS